MEQWAKGDLAVFELTDEYQVGYDQNIIASFPPFPKGLGRKYYEAGLSYFNGFEGFGDNYEILAVEDRFELSIAGHPFVGIADLVLRDKDAGSIVVIDHKSTSMTSMKKKLEHKKRQLYLYADYVHQKFGEDPAMLRFNLFRDGAWIDEPFDPAKKEAVLGWVQATIADIQAETQWKVATSDYFCHYICGVSPHCDLGRR